MSKITEAQDILRQLGLPSAQQNEMSALTLLALCGLRERDTWRNASRKSLGVTKGIMTFVNDVYGKSYAPNTRETFRRHVLHQFVQARIVDYNPDHPELPVNSPKAHYAISSKALETIRHYNTLNWKRALKKFTNEVGKLTEVYRKERDKLLVPIRLKDGKTFKLSAGRHNEVQAAVIEKFAPRFAEHGILVYLGDTAKKDLHVDKKVLKELNININQHSKLPDVVIYDSKRNWLFLIEVVTSHGPVSPKRLVELEKFLKDCKAGKIYVTAFPDFAEFKRHSNNIAWETEVWLVEAPDHMIHFNGDRFMGPR